MEMATIFVNKTPKNGLFWYKMANKWPKMAQPFFLLHGTSSTMRMLQEGSFKVRITDLVAEL
jgi:hypothetical protein